MSPSLSQTRDAELAAGRTCYRHLAGELGVGLLDDWLARGLVTPTFELTDAGRAWFAGLGVDTDPNPRRPLLRPCLDGTVRRPHAAGALSDRFAAVAFEHGWVVRGRHPRAAALTGAGRDVLGFDGANPIA